MLLAQQQQQRARTAHTRTVVTTTTVRSGDSSGASIRWCMSPLAIIKWLQMIFAAIIIAVIASILCDWKGAYDFILFTAAFCLCVVALTLLIYFLRLHSSTMHVIPWRSVEVGFNVLALLLYLAATGIALARTVKYFNDVYPESHANFQNYYHNCLYNGISFTSARDRAAAISAFCIGNVILHILAALYAYRSVIF